LQDEAVADAGLRPSWFEDIPALQAAPPRALTRLDAFPLHADVTAESVLRAAPHQGFLMANFLLILDVQGVRAADIPDAVANELQ
jgi:hypothetical protein